MVRHATDIRPNDGDAASAEFLLGADEALVRLSASRLGLEWPEARARLDFHGPNAPLSDKRKSRWLVLWLSFRNPFNFVLLFLGAVSYFTDDLKATIVLGVMITIATLLRFWQEMKALVQADALRKMVHNTATVYRQGDLPQGIPRDSLDPKAAEIPMRDLVPGDVIRLSAGDLVPADVILLEARDLFVSQSALTGEAMPVEKEAWQPGARVDAGDPFGTTHLALQGTSVISGMARALVLATGAKTYMGFLAGRITGERPATDFDKGVNRVSWILIRFMLVMVPIVFLINGLTKGDWLEAFFFGVAVAVGLTPEMLPMIVNANLARGAVAMSRRKCVVKNMSSIQNLGAMDVLCTDKTGTLTQDRVVLIHHLDIHGKESSRVLEIAYFNSLFQTGLKNLIDRAVIDAAAEQGLRDAARDHECTDELPFDFNRRRLSVLVKAASGTEQLMVTKGATDEMLDVCAFYEDQGRILPLDEAMRAEILRQRDDHNEDGFRVIAVAYKTLPNNHGPLRGEDETQLVLCGTICFLDPPKESAREALRLLKDHGVGVKVITGDNANIARRICRDVELDVSGVLTGTEVEKMDDDELRRAVDQTTIFAKASPMQKARIVRAIKANGHTVGFMGDGVNDAVALREADVGISVDTGTDVAKEAADIILLEKSLLVLEEGVIEGRVTFGNITKYIKMTASSNFGNVFSVLVASAFIPFLPMLAIHLLIQNLLYDISQISIPWDRMDEDWLKTPKKWASGHLTRFMICIGPISSIFDITTYLGMWFLFGANSADKQSLFHSGWFVEGLLSQTLIVHMIRTEKIPFIQSAAAPVVILLSGIIVAIGCLIPFTGFGHSVGLQALPPAYWPFLIITLFAYCVLTQTLKRMYIRRFGAWL
ncbi:magnesium-translocating P-type ATPase [Luteolibacter ambystomatis]|uniref:Magnesium-transporting ATPase, P-type 1 n=1 Tax=Luteolibacter ambystomatis TaxID=2824561 RepID=A0A975G9D0_9BACT|nr:magnesium-translocating P-type ATPase [Luteolibacter ambystomatis]QUE51176.1 magnesium-translocating P-type ATPase [Luteolibacter ambystomatis]